MKRFTLLYILLCSTNLQAYDLLFLEDWDSTPATPNALRAWTGSGATSLGVDLEHGNYVRLSGYMDYPYFFQMAGIKKDYAGNVDFKELGVSRVCVDIILHSINGNNPPSCQGLTLALLNDMGTSTRVDDWGATTDIPIFLGVAGSGWQTACFDIPSQSEVVPPGWALLNEGGAAELLPPDASWNQSLSDVDRLNISFGELVSNPFCGTLEAAWDLGLDNIAVYTGGPNIVPVPALGRSAWLILLVLIMGVGLVVLLRRESVH
ncbi:MAG: hypothetical protein ACWA5R_08565 [bacterium]